MKSSKIAAIIFWGLSVIAILSALLISEGILSKMVIVPLGLAIVWFIIGIKYWRKK